MARKQKYVPSPTSPSPQQSSSSSEASAAALREVKAEIAALRRSVVERLDALDAAIDRALAVTATSTEQRRPAPTPAPIPWTSPRYHVGDEVYIPRLGGTYVVVEAPPTANTFKIQAGAIRAEIRYDEVWSLEERHQAARPDPGSADAAVREAEDSLRAGFTTAMEEIDLHGYSERDAVVTLELFLHHAFMRKIPRVRVIHGKGAGVLRDAVRRELQHAPIVKSVEIGPEYRGDDGVTIANLDL